MRTPRSTLLLPYTSWREKHKRFLGLFTGVDVVNNRPRRWRVENNWGDEKCGRKGFFVMNDSWFDEHIFEIAARKNALPKPLQRALKLPPIVLPPWDPMRSLAR